MRMNRILLVDDDESYIHLLSIILESKGIEATIATNGHQALGLLGKTPFHMLITDCNMPGMDGIELATKAKALYPEIQIVMITCDLLSDVIEPAAQAGISRILSKPVNVIQLLAIIRSTLRISTAIPS